MISSHRKEVVPSDSTLNRCVDVVNECSKKIGHICFLANTPYHHVSVANDAAISDDYSFFLHHENSLHTPKNLVGVSSVTRSFSRGSICSSSSHITIKEHRRMFAIELSKLMIAPVMKYINLRKNTNYYEKDENYDLYWALGCMHRWLEEDAPNETEDQKYLETIDNRNEEQIKRDNQWRKDGDSIIKLLVVENDVPRYGYPQLLELVGRVGLLSKEFFPFTSHTEDAQKDFFDRPTTNNDKDNYHADNLLIRQNPDLFYTRIIINLLTPPKISIVEEFESSFKSRPRSANSIHKEYPSVKDLSVKTIRQEQDYVLELFRTWARALATYFLHCELMLREEISNKLEKERKKKDEHEFEVQRLRQLNELLLEQSIREETERKYLLIDEEKCHSIIKNEEMTCRQKEAHEEKLQKQRYEEEIKGKKESKENALVEQHIRDRFAYEEEEYKKRRDLDNTEKYTRDMLTEDISRKLEAIEETQREKLEYERAIYIRTHERALQRELLGIIEEEAEAREHVCNSERKYRVKIVREMEECMTGEIQRSHLRQRKSSRLENLENNEDEDTQNRLGANQTNQTAMWKEIEENKELKKSNQHQQKEERANQERMLQEAAAHHRKMIDEEHMRQKEDEERQSWSKAEEQVIRITSQHVIELEKVKHQRDISILTSILDLENQEETYLRRIIENNEEVAERKHIYQLSTMDLYEIEETEVAEEIDRRRAERQHIARIKRDRELVERQEAAQRDEGSLSVMPDRPKENDRIRRLIEKQRRDTKPHEQQEEMFFIERGVIEYGAAAVGCEDQIDEVGEMVSREILKTEEDKEFNKLMHNQLQVTILGKEATAQRLRDEAEEQMRAKDEIARENEILERLRERQIRDTKHRIQLEEMFFLERGAIEYGAAAVGCEDRIDEVGEMVSREILKTEEDKEFNKLMHNQPQVAILGKEATAQRLRDEAKEHLRVEEELKQIYLITAREENSRVRIEHEVSEIYVRWGVTNEEWDEFQKIVNDHRLFLIKSEKKVALVHELRRQQLGCYGQDDFQEVLQSREIGDFMKEIPNAYHARVAAGAKVCLKQESANVPQPQYTNGIDRAITSAEFKLLQNEMEALKRENRYLCGVVDAVSANQIRLHQHVLETDEENDYQLSVIRDALTPPDAKNDRYIDEFYSPDVDRSILNINYVGGDFKSDLSGSHIQKAQINSDGDFGSEGRVTHSIDNLPATILRDLNNDSVHVSGARSDEDFLDIRRGNMRQSSHGDRRHGEYARTQLPFHGAWMDEIQSTEGDIVISTGFEGSRSLMPQSSGNLMPRKRQISEDQRNRREGGKQGMNGSGVYLRHRQYMDRAIGDNYQRSSSLQMGSEEYRQHYGGLCDLNDSEFKMKRLRPSTVGSPLLEHQGNNRRTRHSLCLIDAHRKESEQKLKIDNILRNIMRPEDCLGVWNALDNNINVTKYQEINTLSLDNDPSSNICESRSQRKNNHHTMEDPMCLFTSACLPWVNREEIEQSKNDHLKRIQTELSGHRTETDTKGKSVLPTEAYAEIEEVFNRQKYEMNVVGELIQEIRARSLCSFRRNPINYEIPLISSWSPETLYQYMTDIHSDELLPTPCIKLDLSVMTPWITDMHFGIILQALIDAARAPTVYLSHNFDNVAFTIQVIDITRCRYVNSVSNLTKLALLVEVCPMLLHVMYDKWRFIRIVSEESRVTSNSNEDSNDELLIINPDDEEEDKPFTDQESDLLKAFAALDHQLSLKAAKMRDRDAVYATAGSVNVVKHSRPMSAILRRRRLDGTVIF